MLDVQRSAFLTGHKIRTRVYVGAQVGESLYRIDRYHHYHSKRGSDGQGFIEFTGLYAHRNYRVDDGPAEWIVEGSGRHVVAVGEIHGVE